jgi:Uma2 family endonuclease
MTTHIYPPRTMLEVYKALPEGTRVQLINDQLIMSPAPLVVHADIIKQIFVQLYAFVEKENKLGKVYVAPVDVYLNEKNVYQPDIIFISNERKEIIHEDAIYGAPDLVIEVLSPANKKYDKGKKKDVYLQSGVKEYWIIEPENFECVDYKNNVTKWEAIAETTSFFKIEMLQLEIKIG